jgi:SAM-dependent methyltransferase
MNSTKNHPADQAILLAGMIREQKRLIPWLSRIYWFLSLKITRFIEKYFARINNTHLRHDLLNFGCGTHFSESAVNSDLFGIHRIIFGRKRPDIYWTGLTSRSNLQHHFSGIICEHVLEHIYPDQIGPILLNFREALKPGGCLVISFPDVGKILSRNDTQGFSSPTVSLNSVVYRYGHAFMYDTEIVGELLTRAGFSDIEVTSYENAPLQKYLDPDREPESAYITAIKSPG